jgi:phospholipid/cholesterol/gamma-HCH transport system substrate-binding protein
VKQDSIVKLSGIEVGRVSAIRFLYDPETKVEMDLAIDQKAKIHEDSIAFIATSGMIGDAYIGLTPGSASKPVVKPGGVVSSEDPVQVRNIWKKAEAIAGDLDATLLQVKVLAENVNGVVAENRSRIENILANIEQTSANAKEFSRDLKEHPWKLLMKK